MATPLSEQQIHDALRDLNGWVYEEGKLQRHLEFHDFKEAMGFITRIAFEAEALNHHPDWHNVYNTVDITLATHDAGDRVTQKDVELAKAIEAINWR